MKKLACLFLLVSTSLTTFAQTKMSSTEIATFKKAIQSQANKMQSIVADFEEAKHIKVLKNSTKSTGIFKYKKDQLLWQYQAPKKTALLFSSNKLSMKNEKQKVTTIDLAKNKRFKQLQQLMLGSYNGNLFDEEHFSIEYYKDNTKKWAILRPKTKDMSKYIKEVVLWFKNEENTVSEIKITESNDDFSIIKIFNKKINVFINDSEFRL